MSAFSAMLEDLCHRVLEASSAAEALQLIEPHSDIDLVITDHAMPNMSGAQLAGILKRRSPALPIIIATGYAELPDGIAAHLIRLAKPFSQRELQRAVSGAIQGNPTTSA